MNAQRPWAPLRAGRKPAAPPPTVPAVSPVVDYQSWNCFEDATPTKRCTWAGIAITLFVFACAALGVVAIVRAVIAG